MKTVYIIFCDAKPQDNKEVLNLMMHFCREHDLEYHPYPKSGSSLICIEGMDYSVQLQEKRDTPESSYWMIYCLLKGRSSLFKSIA